jgi:hypothetical protein
MKNWPESDLHREYALKPGRLAESVSLVFSAFERANTVFLELIMPFRHNEKLQWNSGICDIFWQSVKRRASPRPLRDCESHNPR